MHWLATVLVVSACQRPVAAPLEVTTPPPDAGTEQPVGDAAVRASVVRTRFVKLEVAGGDQIGTLPVGRDHGIAKDWTACVLQGSTNRCFLVAMLEIVRVEPRLTRVRLRMTEVTEIIGANPFVLLTAPP